VRNAQSAGDAMVKVLIRCFAHDNAAPHFALSDYRRLLQFAKSDRFKVHQLVGNVWDIPDLIIFVGPQLPTLLDFRRSDEWKRHPEKCFVYYGGDRPLPLLPGIYPSVEPRFYASSWTRTASYLRVAENTNIDPFGDIAQCDLLYSFSGAGINHQVRREILRLQHKRGVVLDTSSVQGRQRDSATHPGDKYIETYLSLLKRSKFILCPRGVGTSSWRLFETMKAGRVPVIISDDWIPPEGPLWPECSIRVAESQVNSIPQMLEHREVDASNLAQAARKVWDNWFSSNVIFHRIVEWCLAIQANRRISVRLQAFSYHAHLLRPHFFRHWLMADIKRSILG
jgi:hypothetical protein